MTTSIEVHPATADRWSDVVRVFGRRGDDPSWCWCQRFLRSETASDDGKTSSDNRRALFEEISRAVTPPGLIAYVRGTPVGWTRVAPRDGLRGVRGNRALSRVLANEDAGVWWVTCFAVASGSRRSGVGFGLLEAAVRFAREQGAVAVEGHPVDVARLHGKRVGGSALFTGTRTMFVQAGFQDVARTHPSRPVMRLLL